MMASRGKRQTETDQALLDALFQVEADWKKLREIVDNSIDPFIESEQRLQLVEAKYMFLLREAKHRRISLIRY